MKNSIQAFCIFLQIILCSFIQCPAQVSDYIYGIDNPSAGNFFFSKVEISSGALTQLTQMPVAWLGTNSSSCVDPERLIYYFCSGDHIMGFDPITGNLLSNQLLPLAPGYELLQVQYNTCDSSFYGILNHTNPVICQFARYKPVSNTFTVLSSLGTMGFCMGCQGMLDPDSSIYSFFNGNMIGISIATGQVLYNNPVVNLTDESFGHVALQCQTHQVFGTSANQAQGVKYLSIVNPYTGIISHVSETGWQAGFIKTALGGSFIDQDNFIFYYGAVERIVGASLLNGAMVYNKPTSPQTLVLIRNFSGCNCHLTGIEEFSSGANITISPNPVSTNFTISSNFSPLIGQLEIHNLLGEKIYSAADYLPTTIDCRSFPPGIYFVSLQTENDISVQKLIKQ